MKNALCFLSVCRLLGFYLVTAEYVRVIKLYAQKTGKERSENMRSCLLYLYIVQMLDVPYTIKDILDVSRVLWI